MDAVFDYWLMWLIIAALLVIVELFTNFIASFCIAVGCLVAMVLSVVDLDFDVQLLGLVIGTVVAFIVIAPIMRKFYRKGSKYEKESASNMEALVDRVVIVSETIPKNGVGRVKVDGDSWQARSVEDEAIEMGAKVRIKGNESIVLLVERNK